MVKTFYRITYNLLSLLRVPLTLILSPVPSFFGRRNIISSSRRSGQRGALKLSPLCCVPYTTSFSVCSREYLSTKWNDLFKRLYTLHATTIYFTIISYLRQYKLIRTINLRMEPGKCYLSYRLGYIPYIRLLINIKYSSTGH